MSDHQDDNADDTHPSDVWDDETSSRLDIDALLGELEEVDDEPEADTLIVSTGAFGAEVATRTVGYRRQPARDLPMVGRGIAAIKRRVAFLEELGHGQPKGQRALLFVSAAELCSELGERDEALRLFGLAHEDDPNDVVAIRALRRGAIEAQDWTRASTLLRSEAGQAIGEQDQVAAWLLLAEVALSMQHDYAAALHAVNRAAQIAPNNVAAAMLATEVHTRRGSPGPAAQSLHTVANLLSADDPQGLLQQEAASLADSACEYATSLQYAEAALATNPSATAASLCAARAHRILGEQEQGIELLVAASNATLHPRRRLALRRAAARWAHMLCGDPKRALTLLADADDELSARLKALAAADLDDRDAWTQALTEVAQQCTGSSRAIALIELAQVASRSGQPELARQSAEQAAVAAGQLTAIEVLRQSFARNTHDAQTLADVVADGSLATSAIRSAAKLSATAEASQRELELLQDALDQAASPAAQTVGTDLAAQLHNGDALRLMLGRKVASAHERDRLGALLATAEAAHLTGDTRSMPLQRAKTWSPGDPHVCRALALMQSDQPEEATTLWQEHATAATPDVAAFCWTMAAHYAQTATQTAEFCMRALDSSQHYDEAAWVWQQAAGPEQFDAVTEYQLRGDHDGEYAARLWAQRALNTRDPRMANAYFDRALQHEPQDTLIAMLIARSPHSPAEHRLTLLSMLAEHVPLHARRTLLLTAAELAQRTGEPQRALKCLTAIEPSDPIAARAIAEAHKQSGQHVHVAGQLMEQAREAKDDASRQAALRAILAFDLYDKRNETDARLSLQALLEQDPTDVGALRLLESLLMDVDDNAGMSQTASMLSLQLTDEAHIAGQRHLAAIAMAALNQSGARDQADAILAGQPPPAAAEPNLLRKIVGAGYLTGNPTSLLKALERLQAASPTTLEAESYALEAARVREMNDGPLGAAHKLAVDLGPDSTHPIAVDELGRLYRHARQWSDAASTYMRASSIAANEGRAAFLAYRAGRIFEERLQDAQSAEQAYERVARLDVTYLDTYDRLLQLYENAQKMTALDQLVEQRLAAGGDTPILVDLRMTQARLATQKGDLEGAEQALNASLDLDPRHANALRQLADLHLQQKQWEQAAEVLIRIARVRHDAADLRWAFFTLGALYEERLGDEERAQAAFERVLGVVPQDTETMSRLANLYGRRGMVEPAVQLLTRLREGAPTTEERRQCTVRIAGIHEQNGEARQAEETLEDLRRSAPLDEQALSALAGFYRRQGAETALAMHLNRGAADVRRAIERDPRVQEHWRVLTHLVEQRRGPAYATSVADAASTVGVVNATLSRLDVPRNPKRLRADDVDRLIAEVAPPSLSPPLRGLLSKVSPALDKVLPFDSKAWRAARPSREHKPLASEVARVATTLGLRGVKVLITDVAPRVCVPVSNKPITVVLGRDLQSLVAPEGRAFLIARALMIARAQLSAVMRVPAEQAALAVAGLVAAFDPDYAPLEVDRKNLPEASKRWAKLIKRRDWDDTGSLAFELRGRADFRPSTVTVAAAELGNRAALCAYGSISTAIAALLALGGSEGSSLDQHGRLQAIQQTPEAWSLLRFAISDEYFEALSKLGGA